MLKVFKDATLLFSADSKSTIANVITTMDKIDDLITTTVVPATARRRQRVVHVSIREALALAKKTMNKYYSATDDSNVYRIAMGTHCIFLFLYLINRSTSSGAQTRILQVASMGTIVDQDCGRSCAG